MQPRPEGPIPWGSFTTPEYNDYQYGFPTGTTFEDLAPDTFIIPTGSFLFRPAGETATYKSMAMSFLNHPLRCNVVEGSKPDPELLACVWNYWTEFIEDMNEHARTHPQDASAGLRITLEDVVSTEPFSWLVMQCRLWDRPSTFHRHGANLT